MVYDGQRAAAYAARWWNGYNPRYTIMPDDCTNFISQCLLAGGLPMEVTGRRDRGWWYVGPGERWSFSWAVAHSLHWYLSASGRGALRGAARDLELGDVVNYDWDGDGVWTHTTLVVGRDGAGEPLVAAHTVPSWNRPWRYQDSRAHSRRTKYLFWHIKRTRAKDTIGLEGFG